MTHRFPIKEIARQSGLGTATVDRVINGRAHVSPQSKARVEAAIAELEGQEAQLAARGRRMFFDFIVEAPRRFSHEIRQAAELVIPQIGAAVCRSRFLMQEVMSDAQAVTVLSRIAKRGSHGVCLKARDTPEIRKAVFRLSEAGIPVVTLVTDIAEAGRIAYVGLDNHGAGRTAAYLVAKAVGDVDGAVLATRSDAGFLGEEARENAFVDSLKRLCPRLRVLHFTGGSGRHFETSQMMNKVVATLENLRAVYSMGGGNLSILEVLQSAELRPDIFVAHDLDQDNRVLIEKGLLSFVLHHDLQADMRNVFHAFLGHHRLEESQSDLMISDIQVVTPENIPRKNRH